MRRLAAFLILAFGCPSSPPPEDTTPNTLPEAAIVLDGQELYAARPLDQVPQAISNAWERYQEAWADEPPMPPEDADVDAFREFVGARFAPYVDAQVTLAVGLVGALDDAADDEQALVYAVLAGRLLHRAASWMWTLPLPDEASVSAAGRQALERTVHGAAQNLATSAHQAFGECVELAGRAALEPWRADCARRAEALEPIRTAQIGPPPPTPLPEGCEDHSDPSYAAPQYDPEARPQVLVLVEAESEGVDEAAVQRAVERWARSEHDLRAVPAGRRRAAERLVEAGKASRRGPVCAAAPSLTWVLGAQVKHLVVAQVRQECATSPRSGDDGPAELCELTIAWDRAGSSEREGLPPYFSRQLPSATTEAVVTSLTSAPNRAVGALLMGAMGGQRMSVAPVEANSGYRLRTALESLELGACQTERGASRLELGWTVTPTGAVEAVTVEGGADAVDACVKEKLEQLALPCTPSGDPIAMQTTLCLAR